MNIIAKVVFVLLVSVSSTVFADQTFTLSNQKITDFRSYSSTLNFETTSFNQSTCDDESIKLSFNSDSGAQLYSLLLKAKLENISFKYVQYYWDSSEENCYLRFVELY